MNPDLETICYKLPEAGAELERRTEQLGAPEGDEVVVEICGCGVCHTDLHLQDGHFNLGGGQTMPLRGVPFPISPGHEISGRVIAAGPEAKDVAIGDSVLVYPWVGCGECQNCARGLSHVCLRPKYLGMFADGGFATKIRVPSARYVIGLGDLDPVRAAPLACSGLTTYSAIRKFGPDLANAPLVIIGAGGLGLMAIQILHALGHQAPVVLEVDESRRQAALELGAAHAVDPKDADAVKALRKQLGGQALFVLDLVGAAETVQAAINLLGSAGQLVVVGLIGGSLNLAVPTIPLKAITIQGSFVGTLEEMRELVELAKTTNLLRGPVVTRPLSTANEALNELRAGKVVGRVVLVPEAV